MRCRTPTATLQIRPQTLAWQERTNADLLMLESAKQTEYGAKAPKGQTKKVEIEERKRKKHKTKQSKRPVKPINRKKSRNKSSKGSFWHRHCKNTKQQKQQTVNKKKNIPKTIARENCPFQSQIAGFSACTWSFFHHSPWTSTPWAPWPCSSAARPKANPHLPTFPWRCDCRSPRSKLKQAAKGKKWLPIRNVDASRVVAVDVWSCSGFGSSPVALLW